MFRELMAIMTSEMVTSRSLVCLLENQNGGKLQKQLLSSVITIIISVSFSNFLLILMNYFILYSHYNYSLYNLAQLPIFGTKLSSSHFEGDELVAKTLCDASSMWRRNNISEHISCSFFRSGGLKF
jgi:hypothetical protein